MRKLTIILITIAVIGFFGANAALANENAHNRGGFFIGFGLGWGNAGANVQGVETDRANSGSGNFRLGWAATPNITFGLENSSWLKKYDVANTSANLKLTTTVTTFAVTYFPENMGLYFRGGLGIATGTAEIENASLSINETETGLGLLGAVGYEWRLTQKFAIGPQAQYAYLNINGDGTESVDFVSLTAQMTWYW